MRLRRHAPIAITFTDEWGTWHRQRAFYSRQNVILPTEVLLERFETPRSVDLSFVVALPVHVTVETAEKCEAWVDACVAAGASLVIGWARDNVAFLRVSNRATGLDVREAA